MKRALLSLVFVATAARADVIADMRAALAPLHGTHAIHASLDVQNFRKSEGRFANQQFTGTMSADLTDDESGLRIAFPQAILARVAQEAREHALDPRKPQPTRTTVNDMQPADLAEAVDFAAPFLRLLDVATKVSETRTMRDGKPVRIVVLKLAPKLPPEATSVWNVKFSEDRLTVWVSDENLPVAAEREQKGSAGFLFIKGSMTSRHSWTFTHWFDRLVVTHEESSYSGSGFGQKGEGRIVTTLAIR